MTERLKSLETKYEEISDKLARPEVVADMELYKKLMKEYKELAPIVEKYREYDKFSKCSKCKLMPWCRGCPAVAKGTYGDFYANDPQCWADENGELFQEVDG